MIALHFIEPDLPALKTTDTVEHALDLMIDFKAYELAVVEGELFKGIIKEDILEATHYRLLADLPLEDVFVDQHLHYLEVIRIFNRSILPVVDANKHYKGVITATKLIPLLNQSYSVQRKGGILVLAMPEKDYSMNQISRLIEADNAKILASYLEIDPQDRLLLTIKIDTENLIYIAAGLERFGFEIVAKFQENQIINLHKERLDNLLRFLEF